MDVSAIDKKTLEEKLGVKIPLEPWSHQKEGLLRAHNEPNFAFFFDVGVGKTFTSITSSRAKMARQGRAMKVLVITPLLTLRNWMMEWRKYSNIDHAKIIPLTGTGAKRAKTVKDNPKAQVFIASYETTLMADVVRSLLEWGPEILIVDESQKVKSHTAKRSKAVRMISGYVRYRYLLSGTPILKDPMDLFSQFLILDQGLTFGTNFFEFQRKYFYDKNERMPSLKHFPKWVLKKNAEDAIKERISRISMSAKKSEVLDLPPYLVKSIPLAMTGEQEKAYKEMAKDLVTYLDGKSCTAPMALTKSLRLMQIVSGFISLEDIDGTKSERRFEKHTKKLALYELLEDLAPNHKVLVWAVWKQNYIDIRQVFAALGLKHVELTGETNAAEKFRGMDQFNNDPDIRVALCHPGAGGVGVNLVAASYNVYYSRTFSLEEYLQSQARCYRGGSEIHESVTEINLTIENSIDEIVMDALTNKSDMSNRIIGELSAKLRSQL